MSYSWGASRGSTRIGAIALDRAADSPGTGADTVVGARSGEHSAPAHVEVEPVPEQERVAAELAPMVEVWQRLLAQHVPDRAGRCRTCTKGGTGLPTTPWPCVIHGIADMARRQYDAERSHAAS
jgi:hypothetical protein